MTIYLILISALLVFAGLDAFGLTLAFCYKGFIRSLIVVPLLRVTGYRFPKYHRQQNTLFYRLFNTTLANLEAGMSRKDLAHSDKLLADYLKGNLK